MGISKKKKTAIILGTACAIFATSAIITGVVYSKMNKKEPIDNDQRSLKEGFHKMMW